MANTQHHTTRAFHRYFQLNQLSTNVNRQVMMNDTFGAENLLRHRHYVRRALEALIPPKLYLKKYVRFHYKAFCRPVVLNRHTFYIDNANTC